MFSGLVRVSLPQGLRTALGIIGLSFLLAACAANPQTAAPAPSEPGAVQLAQSGSDAWSETESDEFGDEPGDNDPLEVPNRMFFAFNEALDFMIIRPVAVTYR
ncbi:MAG TPA: MlaA family lipoprotein, partial [Kiloniellaceae bacterium]|nr:MlaA family lipoprotein [Kiloniellaceae bacterium]